MGIKEWLHGRVTLVGSETDWTPEDKKKVIESELSRRDKLLKDFAEAVNTDNQVDPDNQDNPENGLNDLDRLDIGELFGLNGHENASSGEWEDDEFAYYHEKRGRRSETSIKAKYADQETQNIITMIVYRRSVLKKDGRWSGFSSISFLSQPEDGEQGIITFKVDLDRTSFKGEVSGRRIKMGLISVDGVVDFKFPTPQSSPDPHV